MGGAPYREEHARFFRKECVGCGSNYALNLAWRPRTYVGRRAVAGRPAVAGPGRGVRSSAPLYDALAADYDAHFAAPHRRAYDELAWEVCAAVVAVGAGGRRRRRLRGRPVGGAGWSPLGTG